MDTGVHMQGLCFNPKTIVLTVQCTVQYTLPAGASPVTPTAISRGRERGISPPFAPRVETTCLQVNHEGVLLSKKKSDYPDPPSLILFTRHRICVRYMQHMKALGGIEDFSDLMLAIHPFLFEHGRLAGVKEKKVDLAVRTKSYRVCVEI